MASPYHPPSPTIVLPPQKRQKLSPNSASPSPYPTSPALPNVSLPGTPGAQTQQHYLHNPQYQPVGHTAAQNGVPQLPIESFPRASPAAGMMGPPQKPADKLDKPVDINDLNDLVSSSGIDIREEENYLAQTYRNQHHSYQHHAQGARPLQPHPSFTSSISTSPTNLPPSPTSQFQTWNTQSSFGAFQQGAGGPLQEQPVGQLTVEEEIELKHKSAARKVAEARQNHLNDPFIQPQILRPFVSKRIYATGVRTLPDPLTPVRRKSTIPGQPSGYHADVRIGSRDGRPVGIVEARGASVLGSETAQSDILALLSLAAQERTRNILEEAYSLSRSRQSGSHGLVPPEWADVAKGEGKPEQIVVDAKSTSGTAWDGASTKSKPRQASSSTVPQKRLASEDASNTNLPTPPDDNSPSPLQTHKYPDLYAASLKSVSSVDRKFEEARHERRAKRRKMINDSGGTLTSPSSASPGDHTNIDSTNPNTPKPASSASSAPTSNSKAATPAPGATAPKMTKKEREKAARGASQSEEALHKNANATARMALGGFGSKYSWLSGGGAGKGGSLAASRSGTSTPRAGAGKGPGTPGAAGGKTAGPGAAGTGAKGPLWARDRKWGEWKEDGKAGKGIQARDWARAMEVDGRGMASFVRAWNGLK